MATLVLATANPRNSWRHVRKVLRRRPHAVGLSEANRVRRLLVRLAGYRTTTAEGARDRRATDTAVLVRRNRPGLGQVSLQVSDALPAFPRVAPDRWVASAVFRHPIDPQGVAVIQWHPVAGPDVLRDPRQAGHPLVEAYRESRAVVGQLIRLYHGLGYQVVVMGDLQMAPGADVPWAPERLANTHGMGWTAVRLDWVIYPKSWKLVQRETIKMPDHWALVAAFRAR